MYYQQNLKYLRRKHKVTQSELGEAVGIGKTGISGYESGTRKPPIDRMEQIAEYFQIDLATFLYANMELGETYIDVLKKRGELEETPEKNYEVLIRQIDILQDQVDDLTYQVKQKRPDLYEGDDAGIRPISDD